MDKDRQDNDWCLKWLILLTKLQVVGWTETAGRQCCPSTNPHRKWNVYLPFISAHGIIITIAVATNVMIIRVPRGQLQTGWVDWAAAQATLLSGTVRPANKSANVSVRGQTILGWSLPLSRLLCDLWAIYNYLTKNHRRSHFKRKEIGAKMLLCFLWVTQQVPSSIRGRIEIFWPAALQIIY